MGDEVETGAMDKQSSAGSNFLVGTDPNENVEAGSYDS